MKLKFIAAAASVLGFSGVALGAFGAHGLKSKLSTEMLTIFETGVRYQMYHVFVLLILVCLAQQLLQFNFNLPACFLVAGIVIFSGSLYILALSGVKAWGAVTPIGGLFLLAGWLLLTLKIIKS